MVGAVPRRRNNFKPALIELDGHSGPQLELGRIERGEPSRVGRGGYRGAQSQRQLGRPGGVVRVAVCEADGYHVCRADRDLHRIQMVGQSGPGIDNHALLTTNDVRPGPVERERSGIARHQRQYERRSRCLSHPPLDRRSPARRAERRSPHLRPDAAAVVSGPPASAETAHATRPRCPRLRSASPASSPLGRA